jgi:predicted transcriptional regulator
MKKGTPEDKERQRERYRKNNIRGLPTVKCLICGKRFRQVGSHIVQIHGMTAREYREEFNLEVKRGILPPDLRKVKAEWALKNGTWKNLKAGKKYWFVKGDTKAGRYKRSPITLKRVSELGKNYNNRYKI